VLAVGYGVIHACVDLATVAAVYRAARPLGFGDWLTPFVLVLGYDVMAFALQAPLGALLDRVRGCRAAHFAGLALSAAAVLLVPWSALGTLILAGLGNALFHVGAGGAVLGAAGGRAAPAGIFVAPGALGLGLGMWLGRFGTVPIWPLALLLMAAMAVAAVVRPPRAGAPARPAPPSPRGWDAGVVLAALLVSVLVRSFVGFGASYQCPKGLLLLVGLPVAAFAGKLAGGFVADRAGWLWTGVGALLLSAPLIAFGGASTVVVLAGIVLFQATMPVTLVAVYVLMPSRPALAFGLPCLALIAGALPTFFPAGKQLYGANAFLALILLSAVALYVALTGLGFGRRRSVTLSAPGVEG
jgi:MFS transporter, FSR family, fosmidomycin resistance protein